MITFRCAPFVFLLRATVYCPSVSDQTALFSGFGAKMRIDCLENDILRLLPIDSGQNERFMR